MRFELDSETRRKLGYRLIDHIDAYSNLPRRNSCPLLTFA